jgi:hypothetical protein
MRKRKTIKVITAPRSRSINGDKVTIAVALITATEDVERLLAGFEPELDDATVAVFDAGCRS